MIVLDTNVISELIRPAPSETVLSWVRERTEAELCTTAITVAEIRYGIARLPRGRRRQVLEALADEVFISFQEQILPFDAQAALRYATIVAERDRIGRPIDGFDAQIASICAGAKAALGGWSYLAGWGVLAAVGVDGAQEGGAAIGAVGGLAVLWDVERLGRAAAVEADTPLPSTLTDRV